MSNENTEDVDVKLVQLINGRKKELTKKAKGKRKENLSKKMAKRIEAEGERQLSSVQLEVCDQAHICILDGSMTTLTATQSRW